MRIVAVCALVMAFAFAAPAFADTIAEVGDAGDLTGTAQDASGAAVDTITGTVASGADADLYRFFWGGGVFSATTVGTTGTLSDTQLYLFDDAGMGITGNDDAVGLRSSIGASIAAGFYYLGISGFDFDPESAGGEIFTDNFGGEATPTGPGGPGPLTGWGGSSSSGTYTIVLSTTTATPEPISLVLFGSGVAAMAVRRRKRRAA
jgi:hypothetical protein